MQNNPDNTVATTKLHASKLHSLQNCTIFHLTNCFHGHYFLILQQHLATFSVSSFSHLGGKILRQIHSSTLSLLPVT